jgi:hypothetical protein
MLCGQPVEGEAVQPGGAGGWSPTWREASLRTITAPEVALVVVNLGAWNVLLASCSTTASCLELAVNWGKSRRAEPTWGGAVQQSGEGVL